MMLLGAISWTSDSLKLPGLPFLSKNGKLDLMLQISWLFAQSRCITFSSLMGEGNSGSSEAGGVVKKADGGTVLRYAWGVGFNTSIQAEALALLQGLKQLKSLGINDAIVMGDSQSIIKIIVEISSPSDLRLSRLINRIRTL